MFCDAIYVFYNGIIVVWCWWSNAPCRYALFSKAVETSVTCIRFIANNVIAFAVMHVNTSGNIDIYLMCIAFAIPVYISIFKLYSVTRSGQSGFEPHDKPDGAQIRSANNGKALQSTTTHQTTQHAILVNPANKLDTPPHVRNDNCGPRAIISPPANKLDPPTLYEGMVLYLRNFHAGWAFIRQSGTGDHITLDDNHAVSVVIVAIGYTKVGSHRKLTGSWKDMTYVKQKMMRPKTNFIVLTDNLDYIRTLEAVESWSHIDSGKKTPHKYGHPTRAGYTKTCRHISQNANGNNLVSHFSLHGARPDRGGGIYLLNDSLNEVDHVDKKELTEIHSYFIKSRTQYNENPLKWVIVADMCHALNAFSMRVAYKISKTTSIVNVQNVNCDGGAFDPMLVVITLLAASAKNEETSESSTGGQFTQMVYSEPQSSDGKPRKTSSFWGACNGGITEYSTALDSESLSLVQFATRFDIDGNNTVGMLPEFVHKLDTNKCMRRDFVKAPSGGMIPASVYWASNTSHGDRIAEGVGYNETDVVNHVKSEVRRMASAN